MKGNYFFGSSSGIPPALPPSNTDSDNPIFNLGQNYPNPFTSYSIIPISLYRECDVRLEISDLNGHSMIVMLDEHMPPGHFTVMLDRGMLVPGNYLYHLTVSMPGTSASAYKMLLVK